VFAVAVLGLESSRLAPELRSDSEETMLNVGSSTSATVVSMKNNIDNTNLYHEH